MKHPIHELADLQMRNFILLCTTLYLIGSSLAGCTGTQSFGLAGRPGDTIVIAAGWNQDLDKSNIAVTIIDSMNISTPVTPRAVINLYPDPVSNLIIEKNTDVGGDTESGVFWGPQIDNYVTSGERDYSQKVVILDLPSTLNPGLAEVVITGPGVSMNPVNVDVLPIAAGSGSSHQFSIQETIGTLGISLGSRLRLAERAPHYTVTFGGPTVPHAIELTLTHDPDFFGGGTGVTYVSSPRADIKNTIWSDNGTELHVILMASRLAPMLSITNMSDFKFYVAGGITGLIVDTVEAYDIDGNPITTVVGHVN